MKVKKLTSTLLLSIICSVVPHEAKAEIINDNNNQYSDDVMEEYKNIQYAMSSSVDENEDSTLNLVKIISSIPFKLPVGIHSLKEFTDVDMDNDLIVIEEGLNSVKVSYDGASAIVKIEGVDIEADESLMGNYRDVSVNRWSYEVVREAVIRKLMSGVEYDSFKPQEKITVADALSGFNTVLLKNYDYNFTNSRIVVQDLLSDLDSSKSQYRDILDITCRQDGENGIMLLNSGNRLYTENMSRIVLARMLYFTFSDSGFNIDSNKTLQFDDCYGEEAIDFVTGTGLMKGYGGGKFNPSDIVSREELASVLVRLDDMYNKNDNSKQYRIDALKNILVSLETIQQYDLNDKNVRNLLSEVLVKIERLVKSR